MVMCISNLFGINILPFGKGRLGLPCAVSALRCTRQSKSLCKLELFLQSMIYGADVKVKESKSKVRTLKNKLCS